MRLLSSLVGPNVGREATMKAFVQNGYGAADVYELVDVDKPVPSADEVLVKVAATAVNDWEWGVLRPPSFVRLCLGWRRPRGKYRIMGCDVAGCVEAVGRNVGGFAVGDEVYGDLSGYRFGGFAEYVCVQPRHLARKPRALSFEQAAAIPHAAELAVQALRSVGELRAGQQVLVNGAAGGVGTLAIQLLRRRGVEVTGVDLAAKLDRLRELGYDHVIAYPEENFTRGDKRYDVIIDVKTSEPARAYLRALKPNGVYATVGGDKVFAFMCWAVLLAPFTRKRLRAVMVRPNKNLAAITSLVETGALAPVVDRVFALAELREALTRFRESRHVGKIVVSVP